jgi:hypothetical protein
VTERFVVVVDEGGSVLGGGHGATCSPWCAAAQRTERTIVA